MKEFDYSLVKNPEYFKDGRMEAHSDHITYANVEEASAGETSYRHSLNGIWKFHYARNYGNTIKGFEREDYSCKDWDDIRVPAHIQMEGYDAPQYANVQYPWEGHEDIHPGEIPEHFNPVASYVKYFTVPEQMKGKRLFISFQGAESGIALWLNGQFVGYSEDSFTPSEFELTDYVKEGENKLAAQVFKWTASSWCEDQDFYRFSGIYREVYLYTVPDVHVYDLQIRAKVWVSMLFSGVTIAVTTVILCIYMECSVIDSVYYVVLGILGSGICTYTGVLLDSTHPKLDWEDEYGALRGNLNAFFNMAIAIVIAIVLCVAGYLVFKFTMIPSYAVYIIFFIIMGAILVILRSITMRRSAWNIDTDVYSY